MKNTSKKAMAEILRKAEQYGEPLEPVKTTNIDKFLQHFAPAEDEPENVEAPEETGPVTVPPFCHYEICRDGKMELCGADAPDIMTPEGKIKGMTAFGMNAEETREYLENVGGTPGRDGPGNGAPNWRNRFYGLPDKYDPSGDPEKQPKVIDRILHESAKRGRKQSAPAFQPVNVAPVQVVTIGGPDGISIPLVGDCVVAGIASPEHVFTVEGLNGFTAHTVPSTPEPEPVDFAALEKEIHEHVTAGLANVPPEPVAVVQPGYCVQIKVYGEWRTQKAGMEGAAAGNMRDGMARMGYEARVMYGPGVEADPVEIKEAEPAPIVQEDPQTMEAGNGEYTREEIEAACVKLMEERDSYRGTGIPGVLWNVGFRLVYQKRAGSDAQIAFIRALIAKKPEKYAPLLV